MHANSTRKTTGSSMFHASFEGSFDVPGFILYLAMQFKLAQEGSNARMAMHAKEKEQEMLLKAARAFYMANILKGGAGGGNPFALGGKQFGPGGNNYGAIRGNYEKLNDFDGRLHQ